MKSKATEIISCTYTTLNGQQDTFDLDSVVDLIRAPSQKMPGWTALIVYQADSGKFTELRNPPHDLRGNSKDEAEEVTATYIENGFGIVSETLQGFLSNPSRWVFIDRSVDDNSYSKLPSSFGTNLTLILKVELQKK